MLDKQQSLGNRTTPETNALIYYLSWKASHDDMLLHIQPTAGEECSNAADLCISFEAPLQAFVVRQPHGQFQ